VIDQPPSLPTSIRAVRFLSAPRSRTAIVDLRATNARRTSAKCDVSLTDDDGAVFAELLGIETHLLPKP